MSDGSTIALVLRDKSIEWTAIEHRKGRPEIAQQKTVPLEWPPDIEDRRSAAAAAHIKSKLPRLEGALGLVLPADRVLLRIVELPSIDRDELMGMAELQVDKFSPFPTDQLAVAIEVLHQGTDQSRVLIAAVQHEHIDHLGEFMVNAGLYPETVDVDVLGWWSLICSEKKIAAEGQEMVLIQDEHCAQLIVARDGQPVVIRALDTHVPLDHASFLREAAEEIEYTLMTLEAGWGAMATQRMTFFTRGKVPTELLESLRAHFGFEVFTHHIDSLPPLSEGLCRRRLQANTRALDLAPAAWRQSILSRQLKRQALMVSLAAVAAWSVLVGGLWLWSSHQKKMLVRAQAEMNSLQEQVASVRELRQQVEWLTQYSDRSYSVLECLRDVAEKLPAGVDITSFSFNKASQVNLRGECGSDGPINDFISALEKSPLYTSVVTEGISSSSRGDVIRSQFRLTMNLPAPPAEEAEGT